MPSTDPTNELLRTIIDALRELARQRVLPTEIADMALSGATEIDALGMDSVAKLNLLAEIEERADLAVSEGALYGRRTLGELATAIAELRP